MSIFENFLAERYIIDFVNKTSCDKGGAECAKMKSENGAIGYRRI